ncbi:MAG: 4-oxalocrotonate tautomerase [Alphaproteobacteria bacterium]|nr:4-oxalocrotonate tautomerase [Alphaproteobacteria bacterium]
MPVVHIDIIKRTVAQKRAMARAVTEAIATTLNTRPEGVHIVIHEMSKNQYADGGVLKSDKDRKTKTAKKTKRRK